jgi:hypothetical protein
MRTVYFISLGYRQWQTTFLNEAMEFTHAFGLAGFNLKTALKETNEFNLKATY